MGDIWAPFGDFGAPCVGFGVLFGGFGWPLGAHRLDQGPFQAGGERGKGESNSVLEPYGIRQTAKFRWQMAIMPYAMSPNAICHGLSVKHTKTFEKL